MNILQILNRWLRNVVCEGIFARTMLWQLLLFIITFGFIVYPQIVSRKVIHIPVIEKAFFLLMLADLACIVLVLLLPKILQRVLFSMAMGLSLFIIVYIDIFGQAPTLTSILSGTQYVGGIPLVQYIPLSVLFLYSLFFVLIQILITVTPKYKRKNKCVVALLLSIVGVHTVLLLAKPIEYEKYPEDLSGVKRYSIATRGTIATYLFEYVMNMHKSPISIFYEMQKMTNDISRLPLLPVLGNVALLQVECLGYELLDEKIDAKLVMPFIHSLQKNSVILKVDGEKVLGSANSDYEVLTTRKASPDFMAYDVVTTFSGNIVEKLAMQGFQTRAFHNCYASYMNRGDAFTRMGFHEKYFSDEMVRAGYVPIPDIWQERTFSDIDLFDFLISAKADGNKKYFDFILTFSMHEPRYIKHIDRFLKNRDAAYYSACNDTDIALQKYYESLEDGTLLVIYGDHKSYFGKSTPYVPFIFHIKGASHSFVGTDTVYVRTDMSHYIRALLGIQ